jgi:hypothetical protein
VFPSQSQRVAGERGGKGDADDERDDDAGMGEAELFLPLITAYRR